MSERFRFSRPGAAEWVGVLGLIAASLLAVVCWRAGVQKSEFEPLFEGAPAFEGTLYNGLWISGAAVSALIACLIAVDVIRRLSGSNRESS
ncbi:hypothetical protein ABH922_003437 [Rhodococcus sp. 27YEA15]|uniref:hypothetical protein n=1 Tax=Rhodococcus sp. 27YEA15 TaxID=3156259 RepID=UPI003C7A9705